MSRTAVLVVLMKAGYPFWRYIDLSAVFNTLHDMFGISGRAFEWFSLYLSDRLKSANVNDLVSSQKRIHYVVPQCSVLGPILFTLYTQSLSDIISESCCNHHKFADDTHLHQSLTPSDFHTVIHNTGQCVDSVERWMTGNTLKLNNDKTEALSYTHSLFVVFSFVSSVPSHMFVFCTVPLSKDCHLSVLCFEGVFSIYLSIYILLLLWLWLR